MTTYRLDLITRRPLSQNARQHWAVKMRLTRELSNEVILLVRKAKLPPMTRAHVVLHYRPAVNRRRDQDNLTATSKVCLDGIVRAGILPDDSPTYVSQDFPVIEPVVKGQPAALWLIVTDKSEAAA